MNDYSDHAGSGSATLDPRAVPRVDTAQLLGQVMFLVAVAIGFTALGSYIGRELDPSTAQIFSFVGLGMLVVTWFTGDKLRVGPLAMGWLYGIALAIGIGLGPVLANMIEFQPNAVTSAAGGTALTVVGAGAIGFLLSKDLASWMRPLSMLILLAVGVSIVMLVIGASTPPLISLAIYGVSALLITVNFNYLRKHGGENDAVWLATGIFVSIINIFISLLNLFSD